LADFDEDRKIAVRISRMRLLHHLIAPDGYSRRNQAMIGFGIGWPADLAAAPLSAQIEPRSEPTALVALR
jgi:hypothetical protein